MCRADVFPSVVSRHSGDCLTGENVLGASGQNEQGRRGGAGTTRPRGDGIRRDAARREPGVAEEGRAGCVVLPELGELERQASR